LSRDATNSSLRQDIYKCKLLLMLMYRHGLRVSEAIARKIGAVGHWL